MLIRMNNQRSNIYYRSPKDIIKVTTLKVV